MAFKEVDPGPAPEMGKFAKLTAIGDKLAGRYVSHEECPSNFHPEKKDNNYSFRTKEGVQTISANFDLHRRLQHALKTEGLKPGYAVIIEYVSNAPPASEGQSGMKLHKVLIDDTPSKAPAPKPPPPADPFEGDIPF